MGNLSKVGDNIIGSEIIKISQQIKELSKTKPVLNLTIGDFDSAVNTIPAELNVKIISYYLNNFTNYPLSQGELSLRLSVSKYLEKKHGINYNEKEILVGGGVRPLIYTIYKTLVDPGDVVVYPVPSWNNNHYTFLQHAIKKPIECSPDNNFFPTVGQISETINDARLICICSPQNPTGKTIDKNTLDGICELIVNENKKRKINNEKPCYLFFDQIYSDISRANKFVHPLELNPAIKEYLICVDGISKSLCATGIRVGWVFGPEMIISKMTEVFSHIGAWSPKPEQNAVAEYLNEYEGVITYVNEKIDQYTSISNSICLLFQSMKSQGYHVDYKVPDGGIYISVYLGYVKLFSTTEEYINFLIQECQLGIVPFEYFGSESNTGWFRISIGYIDPKNVDYALEIITNAIIKSHEKIFF